MSYLYNAPSTLIKVHQNPNHSRYKEILGHLLTNSTMERAWQEIGKRLLDVPQTERCLNSNRRSGASHHEKLWSEIKYALVRSGTMRLLSKLDNPEKEESHDPFLRRSQIRDAFLRLGENAEHLANSISNGPLDVLAYELFPDNMAQELFKEDMWSKLGTDERYKTAHRQIASTMWPSIIDLLDEIALRVKGHAAEAFTAKRIVDHDTLDREFNYFIRYLGSYFRRHLNGPMYGTVARLASVVFRKPISEEKVKQALRYAKT
jgi:hypothetical protein